MRDLLNENEAARMITRGAPVWDLKATYGGNRMAGRRLGWYRIDPLQILTVVYMSKAEGRFHAAVTADGGVVGADSLRGLLDAIARKFDGSALVWEDWIEVESLSPFGRGDGRRWSPDRPDLAPSFVGIVPARIHAAKRADGSWVQREWEDEDGGPSCGANPKWWRIVHLAAPGSGPGEARSGLDADREAADRHGRSAIDRRWIRYTPEVWAALLDMEAKIKALAHGVALILLLPEAACADRVIALAGARAIAGPVVGTREEEGIGDGVGLVTWEDPVPADPNVFHDVSLRVTLHGFVRNPPRERVEHAGPCLDPDKMHGAGDEFGGSDFPDYDGENENGGGQ